MYAVELAVQRNPALHTIEPYAFNSTDVHSDLKLSGGANVDIQAGAFAVCRTCRGARAVPPLCVASHNALAPQGCDMWTLDMSGLNATTMVSGALGGMLGNFQFRFSGALFEVFETNILDPIVVPTADKQFELHNLPRLHTVRSEKRSQRCCLCTTLILLHATLLLCVGILAAACRHICRLSGGCSA